MSTLAAMADDVAPTSAEAPHEPGAPVHRDEIDPELVNLRKAGPKFGVVTSAGVAILCAYLIVRLLPDLSFSRAGAKPVPATAGELDGDLDNRFVEVPLPLIRARAVRLRQTQGGLGLRAVPVAGHDDSVWVLMSGDGWSPAVPNAAYIGRLRDLDALPLADALRAQVAAHPGPSFATLQAVRQAATEGGPLLTVSGDHVTAAPGDPVEIDVPVTDAAVLIITFSERFPGLATWLPAITAAGIPIKGEPRDVTDDTARLDVTISVADVNQKLTAAGLYARVEPVTTTLSSTWGELAKAGVGPIVIGGATIDDARIDLVRITAKRRVPDRARVLVLGEVPEDYWYMLPLAIGLGVLGLLALWALARAIKRDFLAPRAAADPTPAA